MLRKSRPVQLGAGVVMLAIPASAVALTAGKADTQSAIADTNSASADTNNAIQINPRARNIAFGHGLTLTGVAPAGEAGKSLQLEFAPAGASSWRVVRTATAHRDGSFRFRARLRRSGRIRVVAGAGGSAPRATDPTGAVGASAVAPVTVRARLTVPTNEVDVLEGQAAHVHGKLLPALAGRRVRLLARWGGAWHAVATARTGRRGGFDLHYSPGATGQSRLRVRFRGDRLNAASWAHAGQMVAFRPTVASWYADGGGTACGFHAYYGVANRTLPCGAKVVLRYGGRSVTATVDDRGPFVGGREWDLNQNIAGALGFGGVGTVWSSI
jgi:hypothetical protein